MDKVFEGYNKCKLSDLRKQNDITAEINFSDEEGKKDCVKLTMGDKEALIPISELYTLVWSVASEKERDNLIPVRQEKVRIIVKTHKVKVTKDIRKGEFLNVRCETNVPVEIYEGLKGIMPQAEKKKTFNIPIIGAK